MSYIHIRENQLKEIISNLEIELRKLTKALKEVDPNNPALLFKEPKRPRRLGQF